MKLHVDPSLRTPAPDGLLEAVKGEARRRRSRGLAVGGSAAIVVALALAVSLLPGLNRTTGAGPAQGTTPLASCPPVAPTDVPDRPRGFDGAERLVPAQTPATVTLCRYRTDEEGAPVEGPLRVRSGLDSVAADLALPRKVSDARVCQLGVPVYAYLVRLSYDDGAAAWLRAEDCGTTSNGEFQSDVLIGADLSLTWIAENWTRQPGSLEPELRYCDKLPGGRAGQEREWLPRGYTEIFACKADGGRVLTDVREARFLGVLEALEPTPRAFGTCAAQAAVSDRDVRFVARYPAGRSVEIHLMSSCVVLDNGSLSAPLTEDQVRVLREVAERSP